tara:strand:+ start:40432 stop:40716 length:285 start_codon:yes stop_codon:yes gene_type:complete
LGGEVTSRFADLPYLFSNLAMAHPMQSRLDMISETTKGPTGLKQPSPAERQRALDILARSLYRELTSQGYEQKHIVTLATALLGEVTDARPAHS